MQKQKQTQNQKQRQKSKQKQKKSGSGIKIKIKRGLRSKAAVPAAGSSTVRSEVRVVRADGGYMAFMSEEIFLSRVSGDWGD